MNVSELYYNFDRNENNTHHRKLNRPAQKLESEISSFIRNLNHKTVFYGRAQHSTYIKRNCL